MLDTLLRDSDKWVVMWAALSASKYRESGLSILCKHLILATTLQNAAYMLDAIKKVDTTDSSLIYTNYIAMTPFQELKNGLEKR